MTKTASKIRFKAKLCRLAGSPKTRSWSFLVLPNNASAKLPSRGMTTIEGTLNGFPFQATLEPDGRKSHWLKVDRKLSEAAGAALISGSQRTCALLVGFWNADALVADGANHLRSGAPDLSPLGSTMAKYL